MKESEALLLFRVAKRYYEDGRLQSEIAAEEGISRSLVSKLLTRARDTGIVRIEIAMPESQSLAELEETLKHRLGLYRVIVFASRDDYDSDVDEIAEFAFQAAVRIPKLLEGSRCIGIGWGRTLYRIADEMGYVTPKDETTFVPLLGNSGLYNRYLQTSSIANRFAEKYNSRCFYLNLNTFRDLPENAELTPYEQASRDELKLLWGKLETAIVSLAPAAVAENYYLSEVPGAEQTYKPFDSEMCAGELLSQAYYKDGTFRPFGTGSNLIAFPLDSLNRVPNTICAAVGRTKAHSLVWAARRGFVKTIMTDALTARAILELLDKEE